MGMILFVYLGNGLVWKSNIKYYFYIIIYDIYLMCKLILSDIYLDEGFYYICLFNYKYYEMLCVEKSYWSVM